MTIGQSIIGSISDGEDDVAAAEVALEGVGDSDAEHELDARRCASDELAGEDEAFPDGVVGQQERVVVEADRLRCPAPGAASRSVASM